MDLFCGAGGLSRGLQQAGFNVRWAIDSDSDATETYSTNHPGTDVWTRDIEDIDYPDLDITGSLDLLAGGPPCPTFSVIGRAKIGSIADADPAADSRHQLWQEFARAVEYYRPRTFLMENVRGMASAKNSAGEAVLPIITERLEEPGYTVRAQVVDAADFGVPQHRKRLFIIGNRDGTAIPDLASHQTHTEPTGPQERQARLLSREASGESQRTLEEYAIDDGASGGSDGMREGRSGRAPWVTVAEAILDLPPVSPTGGKRGGHGPEPGDAHPPGEATSYRIPALTEYQEWARDVPADQDWRDQSLHNHTARYHNMADLSIYKALSGPVGWTIRDLGDELQPYRDDVFEDNYTKQAPDEPASTIDAHIHRDGHRHIHPTEARSLTVREAARLQSFRDTYIFPVSRTAAYRQVGNAVPPLLAKSVGRAIREVVLE